MKMANSGTTVEIPLNKAELGLSLVLDNVLELVKETRILLAKSRTTHAGGLLGLALQELGKAKLLKHGLREQTQILTDKVKRRQKLTSRTVRIEGLLDAAKRHETGTSLLPKEARAIADHVLPRPRSNSPRNKHPEDAAGWIVTNFLVNWEDEEWGLPSPPRIFAGFEPPKQRLIHLRILTDALEEAAKQLIAE
jgi:hypothetical protein